jgi:hypothetical protein
MDPPPILNHKVLRFNQYLFFAFSLATGDRPRGVSIVDVCKAGTGRKCLSISHVISLSSRIPSLIECSLAFR